MLRVLRMTIHNMNTSYASLEIQNFTPVMQQYLEARKKLQGRAVLLFRMGDFYEAFFEDAELIAREVEITLTGRPEQNYPGGRIPMAGVPARAVKPYITKLLERNYKVYIAEQMADPKTHKGLVPREIAKIFTPGTVNDMDLLDSFKNNFILALYSEHGKSGSLENVGIAYTDISTGEFYVSEFKTEYLEQELARINPSEILIPSVRGKREVGQIVAEDKFKFDISEYSQTAFFSAFAESNFDVDLARQNLSSVFEINSVTKLVEENLGTDSKGYGLMAAGAIIEYLKETQGSEFANNCSKNFDVIKTYQVSEFMMIDANTRRNLELFTSLSGQAQDSFFSTIDHTCSKPGRRKLKSWLEQPLLNIDLIEARQNTIKELKSKPQLCQELRSILKTTYDIDRLAGRAISELISPRELVNLKISLIASTQISLLIKEISSPLLSSLKHIPDDVLDYISAVDRAILDDPALTITEGHIVKPGYSPELDDYISLVEDSETWMKNFEEDERQKSGIRNLKVTYNKMHGYFIETSRLNESKLPEDYVIKQTMMNTVRAVTPELKDFEEKITHAESRRNGLEYKIFSELRTTLAPKAHTIKNLAQYIASLDALLSLTTLAIENNYTCPEINKSLDLNIQDGRHPVIEKKLKLGEFVPNDLQLNDECKINILTGPNMAGKSTFMRQNALIILLAQTGSFVPASFAQIGLVDRIFTRIGASDNLASGQSTFMVEMTETASILNGMSERSFIVLDEIGRGTSTYDGVAIAWSIVEHLAKTTKARTIFATHYHELANLEYLFPCIKNFQVLVVENDNANAKSKIEFLHKVAPGSADKSYGVEVARLAGLPKSVIDRAKTINNQLQMTRTKNLGGSKKSMDINFKQAIADDGSIDFDKLPLFGA